MKRSMIWLGLVFVIGALITACGGTPASMKNIVVYPDAKEITKADSQLFNNLSKIAKSNSTVQMVLNAKDQKIYRLPALTAWDAVRIFYEKSFDTSEWQLVPPLAGLVERVQLPNDISSYNAELWTRGNQTVGIVYAVSPQYIELFVGLDTP